MNLFLVYHQKIALVPQGHQRWVGELSHPYPTLQPYGACGPGVCWSVGMRSQNQTPRSSRTFCHPRKRRARNVKRLIIATVSALMPFSSIVSAQEPFFKYDEPFEPRKVVVNQPFTCFADKRSELIFFGESGTSATSSVYTECAVKKEPEGSPVQQLRITVLGKRADVTASTPFGLLHIWYQVVTRDPGMLVLSGSEASWHVMMTIDTKRGAFVYTGASWIGGQVNVTSSWGRCRND
jgi:hypothetical protein